MIALGLLIIAIGAFCQSSSYVPINKIKDWSWESYWIVQGVFAWLLLPFLGALLAVPAGHSLFELFGSNPSASGMTFFYGVLWGVGGLTFGLSMRYLGVALGQSLALGTCAALGTLLAPIFTGHAADITTSIVVGVVVTLIGIAIIGVAGKMREKDQTRSASSIGEGTGQASSSSKGSMERSFAKGIIVAFLAGFMSACFNIGLAAGQPLQFDGVNPMYAGLPATYLVTLGGFCTNAVYCFFQNGKNRTWSDYGKRSVWTNNLFFCLLAGALWYSQFFGLSLGKGFLTESPVLITFAFCILMALNIVFSNLWGIILKEWKGCSRQTINVLIAGLIVLIISCFLPQLL
ncbi:MAG: rhamnose/proton symporter RhaT [Bacteroidaceae bacterium]|nr:rhamnose/proton symporter RhaT [Bacteroidaceae bacterium]